MQVRSLSFRLFMRYKIFKNLDSVISFVNNNDKSLTHPLSVFNMSRNFILNCHHNLIFLIYHSKNEKLFSNEIIPAIFENRKFLREITFKRCMEII